MKSSLGEINNLCCGFFFNLHKKLIPSNSNVIYFNLLTALRDKIVEVECVFSFFLCI